MNANDMEIIKISEAFADHIDGAKESIDEGMKTFERKQKLKAKRKKTWKWIEKTDK